jgi:glycosyltransferase involved in cell wall biosynthesis
MLKIGFSGHPLIAIPPPGYGAAEKMMYERACALADMGYPIHVFSRPPSSRSSLFDPKLSLLLRKPTNLPTCNNLFFHYCSLPKYSLYYLLLKLGRDVFYKYIASEAKKNSVDLLHSCYPVYTNRLRTLLGDNVKIATEITTYVEEESFNQQVESAESSDLILAVSDFIGNCVKQLTHKPVETLYNAVDPNIFNFNPADVKEKIIVCSGKILKWKGQIVLLEALENVDIKDWRIYFVGPIADVEYYRLCLKKTEKFSKKIRFLGLLGTKDLAELYRKSAIFVCPSVGFEAFGIVNIEAMASGCAVIASKSGGIPEIIENEKTGILFDRYDSIALSVALRKLMNDEPMRRKLGENARRKVLSDFTYAKHSENLINIYKKYSLI